MDPFARLRIWGDWGFQKLDFPSFSRPCRRAAGGDLVLLAWKPVAADGNTVPAARVKNSCTSTSLGDARRASRSVGRVQGDGAYLAARAAWH